MTVADDRYYLLVCTVGGTSEPILASIRHWAPARVLFVATRQSRTTAEAIAKESGLVSAGAWDIAELDDADDFEGCVRRIRMLEGRVRAWRQKGRPYEVVVDFTCGTKCMSAAIAMVSRRWECRFSYVGGSQRTKGGVGIVVSGKERTIVRQNPWNALGYQAIEDACLLFDQNAFIAGASLLDVARKAADDDSLRRTLSTFHQLCEAYDLWDRFQHKDATSRIDNVLKNAVDLKAALGAARSDPVCRAVKRDQKILQELAGKPLSRRVIADLLANAERRRREGRYDDGVARLYRAIESLAQLALAERHGISSTDHVDLKTIPESLQERWKSRAENGKLFLGLQDDYELLNALADETGKAFRALRLNERDSALNTRNRSILAHGFESVGAQVFEQLWKATLQLGGFSEQEMPVFPQLSE